MKVESKAIMIRHGKGYRMYPFALATVYNMDGVEIGGGFIPAGDAIYNSPQVETLDTPQLFGALFDPDFIVRDAELATGIRNF